MGNGSGRELVERFWNAFAERDFDMAVACLSDDFTQRWPQSRERITGPSDWRSMVTHHPTLPDARIRRVYGSDPLWVVELVFDYHDGSPPYEVAAIHTVREGSIVETVEYFGAPFEPAAWRSEWVEVAHA